MDISIKTMQRIEALSPDIKERCCKKLQDGAYSTKVIQLRVSPIMVVGIYEMIEHHKFENESAVIRQALTDFFESKRKSLNK
jgi:hypothetical protein